MNLLYLRIVGIGVLVLAILSGVWYVLHLQNTVEEQKQTISAAETLNKSLTSQLISVTEDANLVKSRLESAEAASKVIRERVVTKIQRVPAAPVQCEPALLWLVDRAIELKGDSRDAK